MTIYVNIVRERVTQFSAFEITQIPRKENAKADCLARIASGIDKDLQQQVYEVDLPTMAEQVMNLEWMTIG